jgi:hypothetical protein
MEAPPGTSRTYKAKQTISRFNFGTLHYPIFFINLRKIHTTKSIITTTRSPTSPTPILNQMRKHKRLLTHTKFKFPVDSVAGPLSPQLKGQR